MLKWTFLIISIAIGLYTGPDRIQRYVKWALSDPDFFRIPLCIGLNCASQMASCTQDENCMATLNCINDCQLYQPRNKQAMCAYICEMTDGYENIAFDDIMDCIIEHKCMSNYPQDGFCVAQDEDADQTLTDLNEIAGDWWVIKGLNCGKDDVFPGGYDWFPCQHERFSQTKEGTWVNQISYCAGKENKCLSKGGGAGIRTLANATLHKPGVIRHEYDSALAPQVSF